MVSSHLRTPPGALQRLIQVGFGLLALSPGSHAITFNSTPSANLDLSALGRVGLAGDFTGISIYEYEGQNQNAPLSNGSSTVMVPFPNNAGFDALASADAGITAMCTYTLKNGTEVGIIVGGAFTSLGGVQSPGAALINPNTSAITALPGLSGSVNALLCDSETSTVYVGGSFKVANSTNAIAWVGGASGSWSNLPFLGFNGEVTAITKASDGHIIFGGSFTGLGNSSGSTTPDQQIINISSANITAGSSSSTTGFSDPTNIACRVNGTDGTGTTWLAADDTAGYWEATFGFGFQPTKLRLWNTHEDGRGTREWRFTALPLNGILNFTYTDPATQQMSSCTSVCPLSSNSSIKYQDFYFVNSVGMDAFRIDISAWYGSGAGLDGIELFENDIFVYAVSSFNEPQCASLTTASTSTFTGPWTVSPSLESTSEWLTASLTDTAAVSSASVVFFPDVRESGTYSVDLYTPGCLQDDTCSTRGQITISFNMSTTQTSEYPPIYQTNNYDKYDSIYMGYVEAASSSFRPSITLAPVAGQDISNLTVVAQRVGLTLLNSSSIDGDGLNSLFDFDTSLEAIDTADFLNSTIDKTGNSFGTGAKVSALVTVGDTTFVGGSFEESAYQNIVSLTSTSAASLAGQGLNGEVLALLVSTDETILYAGGNFTNTISSATTGLGYAAAYDISSKTWRAVGAGVNNIVQDIVPLSVNVTADTPETVIAFTGSFTEILAFGDNDAVAADGLAIWVPSQDNWLQNVNTTTVAINGQLTASVNITGSGYVYAGSLTSYQVSANGAASLTIDEDVLSSFPIQIEATQATVQSTLATKKYLAQQKSTLDSRATSTQNVTGVRAGLFYNNSPKNITVLGGHFTAKGSNGSSVNNLAFIDGANSNAVSGLGSSISNGSTFLALALESNTLWAGGDVTGTVNGVDINGLVSYNLDTLSFATQAPALAGSSVAVNSITVRPDSTDIYVGGSFTAGGSLQCPGVCLFQSSSSQWNRPGSNLAGTANAMMWTSNTALLVGGSLTVGGSNATLATYDSKTSTWAVAAGSSVIPGPVTSLTLGSKDGSQYWVAGSATNGSAFILKYDGSSWNSVGDAFGTGTTIQGIQIVSLTENHASTSLVPGNEVLLVSGSLVLPDFGNASAALFNGRSFEPYLLTSSSSNLGGSISQLFVENQNFFTSSGGHLAVGLVVLVALAISLALIFLIVIAGIVGERMRRKREGYVPAPTASFDRGNNISRVPPNELFGSLNQGRPGEKAPMI